MAIGIEWLGIGAALLTFEVEQGEGPVRFGFPLPASELEHGLRCVGSGRPRLQWRRLQSAPDPETGRVWVELAIVGAHGRLRIVPGVHRKGVGASPDGSGPVVQMTETERAASVGPGTTTRREWRWVDGSVDWRERTVFGRPGVVGGEAVDAGEAMTTESESCGERLRVRIEPAAWRAAGILPRFGRAFSDLRGRLRRAALGLECLPGRRGRGDYGRLRHDGEGEPRVRVVTNLEFDTVRALCQLAMSAPGSDARALWRRAFESARHLVDTDLHSRLGLPYRHGSDHRVVEPEIGHVWLTGLLWAAAHAADDGLLAAARRVAAGLCDAVGAALARDDPAGRTDARDRLRTLAWPLLELESWLRFESGDEGAGRVANALGRAVIDRFDPVVGTVRFGEGERRRGFYHDRLWLVGGALLPALRAHRLRRPTQQLDRMIDRLEADVERQILRGRDRLPTHVLRAPDGKVVSAGGVDGGPEVAMLLEGLPAGAWPRARRRGGLRRALRRLIPADESRRATDLSMVGRCTWWLQ